MVLNTTVVPDILGLHAFKDEAALVRVLLGDFPNLVRVLVPADRAEPRPPHIRFVSHEKLSCPTIVCRGPDCTETAMAVVPAVWDDYMSGGYGIPPSGLQAQVWQRPPQRLLPLWYAHQHKPVPSRHELFIWLWLSCGGDLSHGALCGRESPRTALTTSKFAPQNSPPLPGSARRPPPMSCS